MTRVLPLLVFLALGILLAFGLRDSDTLSEIPSPLIGKHVPAFSLPELQQPARRVNPMELAGQPYLVNFWASWCVTCRVEHPVLKELANSKRVKIVGINFRDASEDAQNWLKQFGNPYDMILFDHDGAVSIDFGVYAAPESFLVNPDGTIVFKQIGALTPEVLRDDIYPRLESMQGSAP